MQSQSLHMWGYQPHDSCFVGELLQWLTINAQPSEVRAALTLRFHASGLRRRTGQNHGTITPSHSLTVACLRLANFPTLVDLGDVGKFGTSRPIGPTSGPQHRDPTVSPRSMCKCAGALAPSEHKRCASRVPSSKMRPACELQRVSASQSAEDTCRLLETQSSQDLH